MKTDKKGFEIDEEVIVNDPGLIRLMELMKSFGSEVKPNNIGFIREFLDDGTVMIEFPIGDDDISEHSQMAPYPIAMLKKKL